MIVGRSAQQGRPPEVGKVHGAGPFLEQRVDEFGPLVGIGMIEKRAGLADRRNLANQVEADPAEELGVVGRGGRLDAVLFPVAHEVIVDHGGQLVLVEPLATGRNERKSGGGSG